MDLKVVWWLLGLAATAGIMVWRVNYHEKLLLDMDKRLRCQERWQSGAEWELSAHDKRLDKLEEK